MATDAAAAASRLDAVPATQTLDGGAVYNEVLAEADIYKVLDGTRAKRVPPAASLVAGPGGHTYAGAMVNEHKVQFVRSRKNGVVRYAVVIHPRESHKQPLIILVDSNTTLSPKDTEQLKSEVVTVKPDGESVFTAVMNSDGTDVELFTFEISHPARNKALVMLGLERKQHAVLGFKDKNEAAAWYVVIANAIGMIQEHDPLFQAINKNWFAGHAAERLHLSWAKA